MKTSFSLQWRASRSFLVAFIFLFSVAQPVFAGGPKLKEGLKLVYEVNYMGSQYDFIVEVRSIDDGIDFNYVMTNANKTSGSVSISADALEFAGKQYNYFAGGPVELVDETTVWVSQEIFNGFKKLKAARMDSGGGVEVVQVKEKQKMELSFGKATKKIKVLYCESQNGNEFWILNSKKNPLIVKMDLGWTIQLKGIY